MTGKLIIILGSPGEAEMPLLADLGSSDDCEIAAVVDPTGQALGASIAEIMGLPVLADLEALTPDLLPPGAKALFVLPSGTGSLVTSLSSAASARGLETVRTDELRSRLYLHRSHSSRRESETARPPDIDAIHQETVALQASLNELEDALAGDTILRRLLELCVRATGASGGSLMLLDRTSNELYISYAVGLSENTLHSTRIRLGEGIAGRVARTRQIELLTGPHGTPERRRDRPDIASALCAPLVAGEQLLGVLNISSLAGDRPLDSRARDILAGLAPRLGRILDGVQQFQRQRTSRIFDATEQKLRHLALEHRELPEMLTAWCGALVVIAEAARLSIVIPCEDGGLLFCENTDDLRPNHWYEPLHNPAWLEVLGSGLPMVARQTEPASGDSMPLTVFFLPVGRNPVLAGLAVHFAHSHQAHSFHTLAGELVFLLERLLTDQLNQRRQTQRAERLSALSSVLAELAIHEGTPGQQAETVCETARDLTGARFVAAVAAIEDGQVKLAGGNTPQQAEWIAELPRLLNGAAAEGWRITTLETGSQPVSVLTAVSRVPEPSPGIVLLGKKRMHVLDGRVFTPQDAEVLMPLAASLNQILPQEENLVSELRSLGDDIDVALPGGIIGQPETGEARLLEDLGRELDRCIRYHNVFGLILLRPDLPTASSITLLESSVQVLATVLRRSDRCYTLADGIMAVIVPEDVQQLDRLQQRLTAALQQLAGDPAMRIEAARVAYPTIKGTAKEMLTRARQKLPPP